MRYEQLEKFILDKLDEGLSPTLVYHNADHTRQVIAASEHLAAHENLAGEDLVLLKTAALMHDTGFLRHHEDHEEISCKLARKWLPDFGYNTEQIERINRMILCTRLPQSATDLPGKILCDADLYYLGGDDYETRAELLFQEYRHLEAVQNREEWQLRQAGFLGHHHFYTRTAQTEREEVKQQHLKKLQQQIIAETREPRTSATQLFFDLLLTIIGVTLAAAALKGFLVPNHFFDGGIRYRPAPARTYPFQPGAGDNSA